MSERPQATAIEIEPDTSAPVGPASSFDGTTIDFGHHAGRTIEELARLDPEYLHWLARHPSGVRYRTAIGHVLASAVPRAGDWQR